MQFGVSWIEDIIRYAPMVTDLMRTKLANGELSWSRAKEILRKAIKASAGNEKTIIENGLSRPTRTIAKPLPMQRTIKRLSKSLDAYPKHTFKVSTQDIYTLLFSR